MKLTVFSHKPCWYTGGPGTGFSSDGGFPFQMESLSEAFDETRLVMPLITQPPGNGEIPLSGRNIRVVPLTPRHGTDLLSKLSFIPWLVRNSPTILKELLFADAVHSPIPGDVGTVGMLGAVLFHKPLFVRYCGNWLKPRTAAEKFWRWFMERFAGGRNVMMATGGAAASPSGKNPHMQWIFSTSLTEDELSECARCGRGASELEGRLITVARQEKGKGTDLVIQSLALLKQEFPDVRLEIVGDGSQIESLAALANALGLQDRVIFHGKVGHCRVMELLQSAEIFCFPSASEGFPKAVLEALACGLPVVATRVSVLPLLLADGAGALVSEPTPEAIASAVTDMLASRERYVAHSLRAMEVARGFSLERWRKEISTALQIAWRQPLSVGSLATKTSAVPVAEP